MPGRGATAREDGADTAERIGIPAITAFCTSSKLGPPRHLENSAAKRQPVTEHGPADNLIDGVVASDIFARDEQFAGGGVEQRGGVEAAGLAEDGLLGVESFRQGQEVGCRNGHGVCRNLVGGDRLDGIDRCLAAQPARAGRVEPAREFRVGRLYAGRQGMSSTL